jgi:hypothetical protein
MADLYLNAVRVLLDCQPSTVIGRVWDRDDDIDAHLREDPARGTGFAFRSYNELSYGWPLPGGALPAAVITLGEQLTLASHQG